MILVGATLCLADAAAVIAEAGASFTTDNRFSNLKEKRRRTLLSWACHYISMIAVVRQVDLGEHFAATVECTRVQN